ncbi:hypothetical protein [Pedobacter sp. V48]|uniref:hypothetical protein n=1 Tax=Pedobacter sp. V48 TaxID=509635 RepID=UPI0003E476FF|nr:hypothetical protein [Pedobacter sp. V48]ETZ22449.1 hypothetical protein N824_23605 [Pedobacter sp. V48]
MFRMTSEELSDWKSQNVLLGLRTLPNVFAEQDVAMLSRVINSETAIEAQHIILTTFRRVLNDSERPFVNQVSF